MPEIAGQPVAQQCVKNESQRDVTQRRRDGPPRRFDHQRDGASRDDQINRRERAGAPGQLFMQQHDIERAADRDDHQDAVDEQQPSPGAARRDRKDNERQAQRKRQMPGALHHRGERARCAGPEVECAHRDHRDGSDPREPQRQGTAATFRLRRAGEGVEVFQRLSRRIAHATDSVAAGRGRGAARRWQVKWRVLERISSGRLIRRRRPAWRR